MRIQKMTATFGRLSGETLELAPGFNLIETPNEGGKSTWCAFLRAMLYGISSRERDKAGHIAEKNRYQPWSGAPMEGSIELVWEGKEITLRRFPKGAAPLGGFEAVYTGTAQPVPGLTAANCGETLTGVSREVFERTAFVGQSGLTIDGAPELESRIAALAGTGEEDVSFSETQRRLKDWRNLRMANRATGAIPKKEAELAQVRETLGRLEEAGRRADQARERLEELEHREATLNTWMAAHLADRNRERRARYEEAQQNLKQAQTREEALKLELRRFGRLPAMEELRKAQGEISYVNQLEIEVKQAVDQSGRAEQDAHAARVAAADPVFANLTAEEADRKAEADRGLAEKLAKPAPLTVALAVLAVLAGLGWLAACLSLGIGFIPGGAGLAAAVLAGAVITGLSLRGRKRAIGELLRTYGADSPEEITARAEAYRALWGTALEAERQAELLSAQVARLSALREEKLAALRAFAQPFAPGAQDAVTLTAGISRALMLEDKLEKAAAETKAAYLVWEAISAEGIPAAVQEVNIIPELDPEQTTAALAQVQREQAGCAAALSRAEGECATMGDLDELLGRAAVLEEELAGLREDYQALTLAMEGLEAANAALQARFSPEVNRRAGVIFNRLTEGRYEGVTLTREFEAQATPAGELLPRRHLALSKGTADQLYLAVRLAICDLTLPEEGAPLVLDDALVTFDDRRAAAALGYLKELSQARQVLLFTCQSREGKLLAIGDSLAYNN